MKRHSYYTYWLFVRSCVLYLLVGIFCSLTFIPCLLFTWILPERWRFKSRIVFGLFYATCWIFVRATLLRITIRGKENIPSGQAVFIANHESAFDIPILGYVMGNRRSLWYAWDKFFTTPVLGILLRRMAIPVNTDAPIKSARALIRSISISREYHLDSAIFPEGSRFADGQIHVFFTGFVMIARKLGCPVVPVLLHNVGKVYPMYSFIIHSHPITVVIGKPMVIEEYESDAQFAERARQWFIENNMI